MMQSVCIKYFFLNCRRQWASFSDLFILLAAMGLCHYKPQNLSSFMPQVRKSHTRFPAQATKQAGACFAEFCCTARDSDCPPLWWPTCRWGRKRCPSSPVPAAQVRGAGEKPQYGVGTKTQQRWEPGGEWGGVILPMPRVAPAGFPHHITMPLVHPSITERVMLVPDVLKNATSRVIYVIVGSDMMWSN